MQKISSTIELKNAISLLEKKKADQSRLLKMDIYNAFESLKPVNFIKKIASDLRASPEFKSDILASVMGMTAGYLSKKIMVGSTNNPFKNIFGFILQTGISTMVRKNSESIKHSGVNLIRKVFNRKINHPVDSEQQ